MNNLEKKETSITNFKDMKLPFSEEDMASDTKDFRRLELYGSNSDACKKHEFPVGQFGLAGGDLPEPLGKEVACIPICFRPKAVRFGDEVQISYDPKSELYKDIEASANRPGMTPEAEGRECLLYVDGVGFIPFWLKNKSSMFIYSKFRENTMRAIIIYSELVTLTKKGETFSFHAPKIKACEKTFDVPSSEEVEKAARAFLQETIEQENINKKDKESIVKASSRDR